MKTILLSIFALALLPRPCMGEDDKDHPKQPKNNRIQNPPQRQVNTAPRTFTPRTVTPRVNNNVSANPQFQPRNRSTTVRNYPRSYTPEVQARLRNPQNFTPPNQDAPRTNNNNWQTNTRTRTRNQLEHEYGYAADAQVQPAGKYQCAESQLAEPLQHQPELAEQ